MDNEINYQNFPYIYEQYLGGNFETFMRGIAEIKKKHIQTAMDTAFNDCFSLKTAKGNALDMWGKLLGISRFIPLHLDFDNPQTGDNEYQILSDDEFRILIQWAYQSQNFHITQQNLQTWLNGFFGMEASVSDKNSVNVADLQDMSETIKYSNKIAPFIRWALEHYDLIPRPCGVGESLQPAIFKILGFGVEGRLNVNRTNFYFGQFANTDLANEFVMLDGIGVKSGDMTNSPFIDTGLTLDSEYKFEVTGRIPDGNFCSLVCGFFDNNNRQGNIFYNASNKRTAGFWKINNQGVGFTEHAFNSIDFSQEFTYMLDKHKITITQGTSSETFEFEATLTDETNANANILLLKYNDSSYQSNYSGYLKSVKITKGNDILLSARSARRSSDNKLGFYDFVSGKFLVNANTANIEFVV